MFITSINLGFNQVGDQGAMEIAKALLFNDSIQEIRLDGNHVGRDGAEAFAETLRANKSIHSIYWGDAYIDYGGAKALAEALRINYTLLKFHLSKPPFKTEMKKLIKRNELLQWKNQHAILLDMCIAMQSLELPAYVLLWIYDQFGLGEESINQFKKISLIESTINSVRGVKRAR